MASFPVEWEVGGMVVWELRGTRIQRLVDTLPFVFVVGLVKWYLVESWKVSVHDCQNTKILFANVGV